MQALLAGYQNFRETVWPERRAQFERLAAEGQRPRAVVIACSDSRVDPAMIFGAGPGELFTIRNVANLVPPYQPDGRYHGTSAALEFAIRVLRVPNAIVLGHGMCGGVAALLRGAPGDTDFLDHWVSLAERARERVLRCIPVDDADGEAVQRACEEATVEVSLENLRTFPWVAAREASGELTLHGFSFDIRFGVLRRLEPDGAFQAVGAESSAISPG